MIIGQVSQQNFNGEIKVIGKLEREQIQVLNVMMPLLKNLIKEHKFDLYIKKNSLGKTFVGTDINSGYVINSENNFLEAKRLAIKDKLQESFITRKIKSIKNAIANL